MRLCHARYEKYLQSWLYNFGFTVGTHPRKFIAAVFLFTILSAFGVVRFQQNNNPRETFTDSDSLSHKEAYELRNFLGSNTSLHFVDVLVAAKDNGSLLRPPVLKELRQFLNDSRFNVVVADRGSNATYLYTDMCNPFCEKNTPLSLLVDVYYEGIEGTEKNYPTFKIGGQEFFIGGNVYNVKLKENSSEIEDFDTVIVHFVLEHPDQKLMFRWEESLISQTETDLYPTLRIGVSSDKLITAEVQNMGRRASPFMLISLTLLVVFMIVCAFRYDRRESKPLESIMGGGIPILVGITTIGLVSATGFNYQSIVVSVLFLTMAIGIDDVFLMLAAWHRTDKTLPVPQRIAAMVQESGRSMTVTSLTNLISFGNGVLSTTPVLQCFAIYASVASVICFLYQIIMFPAIMALTANNEYKDVKKSCLPQNIPLVKSIGNRKEQLCKFVASTAVNGWVAVITLLVLLCYWAVSIYGLTLMESELAIQHLAPPTSALVKVRVEFDEAVKQMQTIAVVVKNPGDLRNATRLQRLQDMVREFETCDHSFGPDSTMFWLRSYLAERESFSYEDMMEFVTDELHWSGMMKVFPEFCEQNEPTCLTGFLFTTGFKDYVLYKDVHKLMDIWRGIAKNYSEFDAYAYTERSDFADAADVLIPTIWQTIISEVLCMAVAFMFFIPDLTSICAAMFSLFSVNLGVLGFLNLWGVGIDPFSLASLLMSIGFSVDICAHVSYHYYQIENKSPQQRIEETLSHIGWPTIQGAICTILAIFPVIFFNSYLLHVFFKTILLVNFFGILHGLFVLPVFLSVFSRLSRGKRKSIASSSVGITVFSKEVNN